MLYLTNKNEVSLDAFKRFDVNDWDQFKSRITYRLMNKKMFELQDNKENIIHQNKMDLTLIYIVSELTSNRKNISSYMLTKKDIEKFNKTEKEIFDLAQNNIENDRTVRIRTLKEDTISHEMLYPIMRLPENSSVQNGANALIEDTSKNCDNIIIITNKYNVFGSSYMFDFNILKDIKNRMQSNFYIIPLSVHQLMCISQNYVTENKDMYEAEDDLFDMLFEINKSNKNEESILTYRMYHYSNDDGCKLFCLKQNL